MSSLRRFSAGLLCALWLTGAGAVAHVKDGVPQQLPPGVKTPDMSDCNVQCAMKSSNCYVDCAPPGAEKEENKSKTVACMKKCSSQVQSCIKTCRAARKKKGS